MSRDLLEGASLTPGAPGEGEGVISPLPTGEGEGEGLSLFRLLPWIPAFLGFAGLAVLAASFVLRTASIALVGQVLVRSAELQQAFVSSGMLYSFEFRNLAIFFGLLAVGGVPIGLLLSGRPDGTGVAVDEGDVDRVRPSPSPSPRGRGDWSNVSSTLGLTAVV